MNTLRMPYKDPRFIPGPVKTRWVSTVQHANGQTHQYLYRHALERLDLVKLPDGRVGIVVRVCRCQKGAYQVFIETFDDPNHVFKLAQHKQVRATLENEPRGL